MDHDDGYDDEEFDFDGDGLDALPHDALQQLEATAIRATQQQDQYYDEDAPQYSHARAPESDYGDDGADGDLDEVINLNDHAGPGSTQWGAVGPQQYAQAEHLNPNSVQEYQEQEQYAQGYHDAMEVDEPPRRSQADPNQLLQRIKRLEQEKVRLAKEVQSEKSKLLMKAGETETARRRLEVANREHERRYQTLQQSHNEAIAAHKAELEKVRKEREQAQTNTMFLEHDLALEADKAKRMKKSMREPVPLRPRENAVPSPAATPKRQQRTLPLRDGFDDEDMVLVSPSKNRDRPKTSTPKANKRKRVLADQSPVPGLPLLESRSSVPEQANTLDSLPPGLLKDLKQDDRRFQLLHLLVNQRSSRDDDIRLFEALAQYSIPSQPEKKLSSRIHDDLSVCVLEHDVHNLARKICDIFFSAWDHCLQEKYYAPIYLFLDAVHLILAYEPSSTAIALTDRAIPTILATVDLVAFPIARACMKYTTAADLYSPVQQHIANEIDVPDCLDLLHLIATSCLTSPAAIIRFWTLIPIDFPLQLLRKAQPLDCISRMLHLLRTSNLPDSIGPRVLTTFGVEQQEKRETDLLDRLTKLLSDIPERIPDPNKTGRKAGEEGEEKEPNTPSQILEMRLETIDLLTHFSTTQYGIRRLTTLRYPLPRLLKHLDESISTLYTTPFPPSSITQTLTTATINTTMKLIYHLKSSTPNLDIKSKLNVIPGGGHRYLVALTRLAFSERLVVEGGVEKECVELAYAMLDAGLTPEEGEGLLGVFGSAGSV